MSFENPKQMDADYAVYLLADAIDYLYDVAAGGQEELKANAPRLLFDKFRFDSLLVRLAPVPNEPVDLRHHMEAAQ